MAAFVLGATHRSASYWDKVRLAEKKEDGSWATVTLDVKFRRWTGSQLDDWFARRKESDGEDENKLSVAAQVTRILDYLEDWKVVQPDGTPTPLTPVTLAELLNEFPGAGREISTQFVSSTYGNREKN